MRRGVSRGIGAQESGGEQGFWPSYADMMSALALILFFLMLLSYIQNLITGNDLQNTQEVLADTQAEVSLAKTQLAGLTDQLKLKQDELKTKEDELNSKELELADFALQISRQNETIQAQEKLIGDQKDYLSAADAEILELRSQMQTIAVLRLSILEQIKKSIVEVMGDESKVRIGDNGNIILSEGVFFDLGSSDLKAESVRVLDELTDVFDKFLSDKENIKYVDSIVISGHTDSTGKDWDNRILSTDRANSVMKYLMESKGGKLGKYSRYFCAAGYGETRPVASNDELSGQAANRRIEISMILKDESVLDVVEQYLAIELPENKVDDSKAAVTRSMSGLTDDAKGENK